MTEPAGRGFDLCAQVLPSEGNDHVMFVPKQSELKADSAPGDVLELCCSDEFGVGVRSLVSFRKGDVVDRFEGRIDPHISQHSLQIGPDSHITETRFVGYLSHGCDPNCALNMEARELIALRDIAAGDFLRVDYAATEDTLYADFDCTCDASACRGRITGRLGAKPS